MSETLNLVKTELANLQSTLEEKYNERIDALQYQVDSLVGNSKRPPDLYDTHSPKKAGVRGDNWVKLSKGERLSDTEPSVLAGGGTVKDFSLGRLLKAHVFGDRDAATYEMKAMGGSSGSGSYTLPTPVSSYYIDLARNATVALDAGVQTIVFKDSKMTIPKLTGDVTAAWRAEHGEISESDPTFGKVDVVAKSIGAMVRVSNELLADSPELAGAMILDSLTGAIGVALDAAILRGATSGSNPVGIRYATGIQTLGLTADVTWADLATARGMVLNYNEKPGAIILNPAIDSKLDVAVDLESRWVGPSPSVTTIPRFLTAQIPTNLGTGTDESEIFVGDFTQAALLLRQGIQLDVATTANDAFAKNQSLIRATLRADVAVFRPKAFCVLTAVK